MMVSTFLFWIGLILDFSSHHAAQTNVKNLLFSGSRIINFFGSLTVFASVIIVGLPDYLEASNLDTICPFCGVEFNKTVRQVAEFSIGLFFACLFTFQLIPILVTIGPALVSRILQVVMLRYGPNLAELKSVPICYNDLVIILVTLIIRLAIKLIKRITTFQTKSLIAARLTGDTATERL